MKKHLFTIFLLCFAMAVMTLLTGCHSGKTYAGRSTVIGLRILFHDPTSNSPEVDLGYICTEGAAVTKAHDVQFKKNYKDVSLFKADGNIKTEMSVTKSEFK